MKKITTPYSPMYFLWALGSGWLAVTFFMYLMFVTKHDTPIPTFDSLAIYFHNSDIWFMILIILAAFWIIYYAIKHILFLIWNLKQYLIFKKSKEYKKLKTTNAEVTLMTLPLTLAMSMNVLFILAAIFIPGLWSVIEYIFPLAIIWFLAIWYLAISIFGEYFTRLITKGDFDFVANNNLSQMLAVFAFAMIWVGLAAPAAMSHSVTTSSIALLWSMFFITTAIFFGVIKMVLGFKSIFRQGLSVEASPSIWIIIPLITLIWIAFVRQQHGLNHSFDVQFSTGNLFVLTSILLSLQIIFWYLGYKVLKANKYFKKYIHWDKNSPGSYSLICPGVALFVFGFFFLHLWLVKTWIVDKFWIIYFILLLPLIYLQIKTVLTLKRINKKLFV